MVTYLRDDDLYLHECENIHPALAHQVGVHCNIRARFTEHHFRRLLGISKPLGFTGSLSPGVSSEESPGASGSVPVVCIPARLLVPFVLVITDNVEDGIADMDDEEGAEVDGEEQSRILEDILQVTFDF
jgi:hypothetical protein